MMPHKTVSSCSSCLQRGLNSRPLVYKTSALPLSYRGLQSYVISYHILANKAQQNSKTQKTILPDRESNPGLPRDRRRSSPLDYRGFTRGLRQKWMCGLKLLRHRLLCIAQQLPPNQLIQ